MLLFDSQYICLKRKIYHLNLHIHKRIIFEKNIGRIHMIETRAIIKAKRTLKAILTGS